jgi:quercetin dioxygenase-like cupin family protein
MGAAAEMVVAQAGSVVSRTVVDGSGGGVTLFAFAPGEGLSEHTSTKHALVHMLEGRARFTLGDESFSAAAGDLVAMPAHVPHALAAEADAGFKMLLCLVEP